MYLLIDTILESSVYLADISLLSFIYTVIAACLRDLGVKTPVKTALKISSFVLISSLIAFWSAILALQIIYHVNSVIDSSKIVPGEELVWTKIEIAYHATFVFASIKLFAFALWIISGQRKLRNPTWAGLSPCYSRQPHADYITRLEYSYLLLLQFLCSSDQLFTSDSPLYL